MKILLISNGYPPLRWAGTETYTAGIAEELTKRGNSAQVLCNGEWQKGDQYWNGYEDSTHHNVPVRRLNLNWQKAKDPSNYLYNNPVIANYLAQYLTEIRPDVVHVTSCETLSASVLHVVREAGIPLVLSLTDFWFLCPQINLLRSDGSNCSGLTTPWDCLECRLSGSKAYQRIRRVFPARMLSKPMTFLSKYPSITRQRGFRGMACDIVGRKEFLVQALKWPQVRITASNFVHDIFRANGVEPQILVRPYGHDLSWLKGNAGKTPSNLLRIGFVGQMIPSKGVHLILDAAHILQRDFPDRFAVALYGALDKDPQYSARLKELASGTDHLEFRGIYTHDQSADVYANMDVLVVPSTWYDFPLVIHEAFATQTPVIATNLGSISENVIHDINGLLFERGDAEDLSRQLSRLITEPELIGRLRRGIQPVKGIAEEVDELSTIYQELMSEPRSSKFPVASRA